MNVEFEAKLRNAMWLLLRATPATIAAIPASSSAVTSAEGMTDDVDFSGRSMEKKGCSSLRAVTPRFAGRAIAGHCAIVRTDEVDVSGPVLGSSPLASSLRFSCDDARELSAVSPAVTPMVMHCCLPVLAAETGAGLQGSGLMLGTGRFPAASRIARTAA